ncbi:MAG: AmmeMemoRadiSam system radical SAM enzyme [Deltaproteobacteria bacterium]|nr:AmmeMemoRadiSam system radical SAM enzyme [Deltaproteobacteria bacterium]
MKEAKFYERLENNQVRCRLCRHECKIPDQGRGICSVRVNKGGVLYSMVYDRVVSMNVDPIEKKPFFHVMPGSLSFSIATVGCNFSCKNCQNHSISQPSGAGPEFPGRFVPAGAIVEAAADKGCQSIAYTYTEPTIFFELAQDVMKEASKLGMANVWVTNGFMGTGMLEECKGLLTAANVDVKSFSDDFYKKICKARLAPVLENVEKMKKQGVWVEVTTLIIPGYNDDVGELADLASWLVSVDPNIPWHVSRFHPDYQLLDAPPTSASTLARTRDIGRKAGLHHVYTGNLWGDEGENTYCHVCGTLLVERFGFTVKKNMIEQGHCPSCGADLPGVW